MNKRRTTRILLLLVGLCGCAAAPPEYVPPGQDPRVVQMRADQNCIDRLARGIDGGPGPLVITRHGFVRDPHHILIIHRGPGVTCAFEWKSGQCYCDVATPQLDSIMEKHEWVVF